MQETDISVYVTVDGNEDHVCCYTSAIVPRVGEIVSYMAEDGYETRMFCVEEVRHCCFVEAGGLVAMSGVEVFAKELFVRAEWFGPLLDPHTPFTGDARNA